MKRLVLLTLTLLLIITPTATAQSPQDAPIYARYCDFTRLQMGEDPLRAAMDDLEDQIQKVEAFLSALDAGNRTFLEAIGETEGFLVEWTQTTRIDCMAAMYTDANYMFSELLIAMLYGQILDNARSQNHLANARAQIDTIRVESAAAREHLEQPVPTPEPTVADATPEPTQEEQPLRASDELTDLLTDYLVNNRVTVLIDAAVQVFPGDTLIVIRLDRFTSNTGQTFDYENTYFTFDVLAKLISDWREVDEVSRIAIETYDAAARVLYAEASGDNFRKHYIDGSLTAEEFQASLLIQEAVQ